MSKSTSLETTLEQKDLMQYLTYLCLMGKIDELNGLLERISISLDQRLMGLDVTPLQLAISTQNEELVDLLLLHGASPNFSISQHPPLHLCAKIDNMTLFQKLLAAGGNIDLLPPDGGVTPLLIAITCKNFDAACKIVQLGANVSIPNQRGTTPLHAACKFGDSNLVKLLLDKVANLDEQNIEGKTAFHYASETDNPEIAKFLLAANASLEIKDIDGKTPYDLFESLNKLEYLKAPNPEPHQKEDELEHAHYAEAQEKEAESEHATLDDGADASGYVESGSHDVLGSSTDHTGE